MTEIPQTEARRFRGWNYLIGILSAALVLSMFVGFESYTSQQNRIIILNSQKSSLQQELQALQSEYDSYKESHSHSNSDYESLNSVYNAYTIDHRYSDSQYEENKFYFYYDKPDQKFGVYSLSDEIAGLTWKKPYQEGVFDCSEMSASLERYLENKGWHTMIVVGNSPFGSGYHAWLLVETSSNAYMPVESTTIRVIWWSDLNFNNYFTYDHSFETIQDALAWSPTEFDWWK
jgi:hypothetical protein